ncbi:hypothetical protein SEVIR_2G017702v4 [Setaria viridis]
MAYQLSTLIWTQQPSIHLRSCTMERAMVSSGDVLTKLAELLHEKYKLAKGVRKDIEFLRSELGVMNDLLYVMADIEELDALLNKG